MKHNGCFKLLKAKKHDIKTKQWISKGPFDRLNHEEDSKLFKKVVDRISQINILVEARQLHSVKMTSFCRKVARLQISFDSFWEVNSLNLFSWSSQFNISDDKVQEIILYFSSHPNILKFKEKFQLDKTFSFQHVLESTVRKVVLFEILSINFQQWFSRYIKTFSHYTCV